MPLAENVPANVRRALRSAHPIFESAEVERAVDQLAVRLTVDWQDLNPIVMGVLPDGIVLMGMLMRRVIFPLQACCVSCEDGRVTRQAAQGIEINTRELLFVHGCGHSPRARTLSEWGVSCGAARVRHIALVSRPSEVSALADTALTCDETDIVGCGVDYAGYGANLPGIYALEGLTQETSP